MMISATDTPVDRRRRAQKYHQSPLGPNLHYVWSRDRSGRCGMACDCAIGREHEAGTTASGPKLRLVAAS